MPPLGVSIVALLLSGVMSLAVGQRQAKPALPSLTLTQLEQLIAAGVPDAAVAKEVEERGLRDDLTQEIINALRRQAAGPRTLAALSALLPRTALLLRSTPGAEVVLGGRRVGVVGETGELAVSDLELGSVRLQIRKTHHVTVDRSVDLNRRGSVVLDLPLAWAVGFLSLRIPQPQARIAVEGIGSYGAKVENLPLPPRTYRITISAPSYETQAIDVVVLAGQTTAPEVTLMFDERRRLEFNSALTVAFENGNHARAVAIARDMQALGILRTDGLAIAAASQWELRHYSEFLDMARNVLAQDGQVRVPVIHHHRILVPSHRAFLTVSANGIRFEPWEACTVKEFSVVPQLISVRARTILGSGPVDDIGVGFEYPNQKNAAKKELVFFVMSNAAQKVAFETFLADAVRLSAERQPEYE